MTALRVRPIQKDLALFLLDGIEKQRFTLSHASMMAAFISQNLKKDLSSDQISSFLTRLMEQYPETYEVVRNRVERVEEEKNIKTMIHIKKILQRKR